MTKEQINSFTLRISNSNKTGIIAVLFDIYNAYGADAITAIVAKDIPEATKALKQCSQVINHLMNALDYKYEISKELYTLYDFCQRSVAKSIYQGTTDGLLESNRIMHKLQKSFDEIAANDNAAPVMKNVQRVFAGYTYGRSSLNEMVADGRGARGFFA